MEHGAVINAENDNALRWSAYNRYLEVVKYLIVDCNAVVSQETLEYLKRLDLLDTISIINSRNLHNEMVNELNNKTNKSMKLKI